MPKPQEEIKGAERLKMEKPTAEHSCTESAQSCSSKQRRWPRSWPRLGPWQRPCVVPVCRVGCQCPACRSTVRLRPNAAMCRPGRSPLAQHALLYTPFSCRKVTVGTKFLFLSVTHVTNTRLLSDQFSRDDKMMEGRAVPKPQEEIKGAEDTMTMASVKHRGREGGRLKMEKPTAEHSCTESAQRCSNNNDSGLVLGHDLVHGNVLVLCRCVGRVVSVGHADPLCDYSLVPP